MKGNGGRYLPDGWLLPVAEIAELWQMRMEIAAETDGFVPSVYNDEPWWHKRWIPFADIDSAPHVIDLRPGPKCGQVGWAPHNVGGDFDRGWPSLGAYLINIADALHHGGHVFIWYPYLDADGYLTWTHLNMTTTRHRALPRTRVRLRIVDDQSADQRFAR